MCSRDEQLKRKGQKWRQITVILDIFVFLLLLMLSNIYNNVHQNRSSRYVTFYFFKYIDAKSIRKGQKWIQITSINLNCLLYIYFYLIVFFLKKKNKYSSYATFIIWHATSDAINHNFITTHIFHLLSNYRRTKLNISWSVAYQIRYMLLIWFQPS